MEPRIQYAKTKDGVSIAFWTLGEGGTPLVHLQSIPVSHVQLESRYSYRELYEKIVAKRKLIRLDFRGFGMSDREVERFSLDTWLQDLEAVVGRLGLETFALSALVHSGPLAIAYAARHSEQVSHLIVMDSAARVADSLATPQAQSMADMLVRDWEMFSENMGGIFFGWGREDAVRLGEFVRACVTPEMARHAFAALARVDVTELLPRVTAPTLVIRHSGIKIVTQDMARGLVAGIPDARLLVIEGVYSLDWERVVSAIDEFLGEGEGAAAKPELPEGMAVILFADIADSTALTEQLGDAAFREKARELDTSLRVIIGKSGGTPVEGKVLGDGVLAVFTSARQAIDCALRCNANSEPLELQLHLGIHAGDVIREGNNVYGGAVNIAARIATVSAPGEVLVSDTVRGLARTSAGVAFDDRGEHELKGIGEPQRLYAVRAREA